jgi:hypothetical protein
MKSADTIIFNPTASDHFKMAEFQTSEVDAKPVLVSLGLSRVKFGNHCWATQKVTVVKQCLFSYTENSSDKQHNGWKISDLECLKYSFPAHTQCRVFLEKLTVSWLIKILPHFMVCYPCSQSHTTGSSLQRVELHSLTLFP